MSFRRGYAMPLAGALSLLFLVGAGCLFKQRVEPPPGPTAADKANLTGIVTVEPVEVHKKQDGANGGSCAVDLVYPTIASSPYLEATNAFAEQVFTFLRHQLESDETFTSPDDVDIAVDQYLTTCLARVEAEQQAGEDSEVAAYLDQYVSADFEVTLNTLHMLSVNLKAEGYTGGAHGYATESFVNADLGGNKLVTLNGILIDEKLKAFFQQEKERLLASQRDVIYPASVEEFETFLADDSAMSVEEQHDVYGQFSNFYLTPNSIVTFYDSYEIAPYAAGPIKVEMPLNEISEYIDSSEPFYPVLEQVINQQ